MKLGHILGSERKIVCGFNLVSELFQSFCRCLVSEMTIASSLIGQYTLHFWFLHCKRSLESEDGHQDFSIGLGETGVNNDDDDDCSWWSW